jgi:hypothetical protein
MAGVILFALFLLFQHAPSGGPVSKADMSKCPVHAIHASIVASWSRPCSTRASNHTIVYLISDLAVIVPSPKPNTMARKIETTQSLHL